MNDAEFLAHLERKHATSLTGWVTLEFDDWRRFVALVCRVRGIYPEQEMLHSWFLGIIRESREEMMRRILGELRK
jgi:hypothetical protein